MFFATSLTNLHFAKMTTQNCCYYITVINATTVVAILAMLWIAVLTCCRFINITVLLWQRIVKLVAKYDKMFVETRNPFLQCTHVLILKIFIHFSTSPFQHFNIMFFLLFHTPFGFWTPALFWQTFDLHKGSCGQ